MTVTKIEPKNQKKIKIVLLCKVHHDGVGDYSHLVDIYKALVALDTDKVYDFIPVIACSKTRYERVSSRISDLQPPPSQYFLYDSFDPRHRKDPELRKVLSEAEQMFVISFTLFPYLNEFEYLLKPQVACKVIGEHETGDSEAAINKNTMCNKKWKSYSLGLQPLVFGIKLEKSIPIGTTEALSLIQEQNPCFIKELCSHLGANNVRMLVRKHSFIPAYFNKVEIFKKFVQFTADRHLNEPVIYFSGSDLDTENFSELNKSDIKEIELITKDKGIRRIVCNPEAKQTIRILADFKLTNEAYKALFNQADFAGVSGDNTLELAISQSVLPFYFSTNHVLMKWLTIKALEPIIRRCTALSKELQDSFVTYFNGVADFCLGKNADPFSQIDFQQLVDNWSIVAQKIHKEHNFYNRLSDIFYKKEALVINPELQEVHWLFYYASHGDETSLQALLKKNPDLSKEELNGGITALHIAAMYGYKNIVQILLGIPGINPNIKTNRVYFHFSPLELAIINDDQEIMASLLEHPDLIVEDALPCAIWHKKKEVIETLLNSPRMNWTEMNSILSRAISTGNLEIVQLLLNKNKGLLDYSALLFKTIYSNQGALFTLILQVLLDNQPELIKEKLQRNPIGLIYNIECNVEFKNTLRTFFKEKKVDENQGSFTALQVAILVGNLEIVQQLVKIGLKPEVSSELNDLELAKLRANPEILKIILNLSPEVTPALSPKKLNLPFFNQDDERQLRAVQNFEEALENLIGLVLGKDQEKLSILLKLTRSIKDKAKVKPEWFAEQDVFWDGEIGQVVMEHKEIYEYLLKNIGVCLPSPSQAPVRLFSTTTLCLDS